MDALNVFSCSWVSRNIREGSRVVFEEVVVLPIENMRPQTRVDKLNVLDEMHKTPLV